MNFSEEEKSDEGEESDKDELITLPSLPAFKLLVKLNKNTTGKAKLCEA